MPPYLQILPLWMNAQEKGHSPRLGLGHRKPVLFCVYEQCVC